MAPSLAENDASTRGKRRLVCREIGALRLRMAPKAAPLAPSPCEMAPGSLGKILFRFKDVASSLASERLLVRVKAPERRVEGTSSPKMTLSNGAHGAFSAFRSAMTCWRWRFPAHEEAPRAVESHSPGVNQASSRRQRRGHRTQTRAPGSRGRVLSAEEGDFSRRTERRQRRGTASLERRRRHCADNKRHCAGRQAPFRETTGPIAPSDRPHRADDRALCNWRRRSERP